MREGSPQDQLEWDCLSAKVSNEHKIYANKSDSLSEGLCLRCHVHEDGFSFAGLLPSIGPRSTRD